MILPLHAQRVDVLHALALVAGGREALPDGLERLATGDPLLAPWARRLAPPLRQGLALPDVLLGERLITTSERTWLAASTSVAAGLDRLAHDAASAPRGLALVRWFPTILVAAGVGGFAVGHLVVSPFNAIYNDLGVSQPWLALADPLAMAVPIVAVFIAQSLLPRVRGLRHLQHSWCPAVHRAVAWRDFAEAAAREGNQPGIRMLSPYVLLPRIWWMSPFVLWVKRVPAWRLSYRTWMLLSFQRLDRATRCRLAAEPSGQARLELLGGADHEANAESLRQALASALPPLVAALWLAGLAGFVISLSVAFGPLGIGLAAESGRTGAVVMFGLLLLCGVMMGGVWAVQVLRALLALLLPFPPVAVVRSVATTVAGAITAGRDVSAALATVAPHLPLPHAGRARAAARTLTADPGAGIVATLVRQHLIPNALTRSGLAAEQLGAAALTRWCGSLAGRPDAAATLLHPLALYGSVGLAMGVLLQFFQIIILPKYVQISRELGVSIDGRLGWVQALPNPDVCLYAVMGLITVAAVFIGAWRWRALRRLLAAETILAGVASGASEGEIAAAFNDAAAAGPAGSAAVSAATAAGAAGDFTALAAAAGWPGVADPTALAAALARVDERDRLRRIRLRIALQILLPLILAVPVWLIASGLFASLLNILYAAGGSAP
jgi:hypothetical protein